MGLNPKRNKLHSFSKGEKLCNFAFKDLLFSRGESFFIHPFKVFWLSIDKNLENIFFQKSVTTLVANAGKSENHTLYQQNPSFPYKKIHTSAYFLYPAKCLIGVSKKSIRSAVTRNHLKRLTREAYRQNKEPLYAFLDQQGVFLLLGIVFTAKHATNYQEIENKIIVSLQKIQESISQKTHK